MPVVAGVEDQLVKLVVRVRGLIEFACEAKAHVIGVDRLDLRQKRRIGWQRDALRGFTLQDAANIVEFLDFFRRVVADNNATMHPTTDQAHAVQLLKRRADYITPYRESLAQLFFNKPFSRL